MKHLFFAAIVALSALFVSCKKEVTTTQEEHKGIPYRVLLFSNTNSDTTISSTMWARVETVGIVTVEDNMLKAELISYDGNGHYVVKVTSKANCDGEINWGWDALNITNITPSNNNIPAHGTKTFTLTGAHKEGKIKLKLECDCGSSSTLIIKITNNILPAKILENVGSYDEKTKKTTIAFTIDDPLLFDWILIQSNNGFEWGQVMLIGSDHATKAYSFKL